MARRQQGLYQGSELAGRRSGSQAREAAAGEDYQVREHGRPNFTAGNDGSPQEDYHAERTRTSADHYQD